MEALVLSRLITMLPKLCGYYIHRWWSTHGFEIWLYLLSLLSNSLVNVARVTSCVGFSKGSTILITILNSNEHSDMSGSTSQQPIYISLNYSGSHSSLKIYMSNRRIQLKSLLEVFVCILTLTMSLKSMARNLF